MPVSELLQQYGPYGAVIALISLVAYWLRLRHVRVMADKHGPEYALRYADILFRPKWLPRRPTIVEHRDDKALLQPSGQAATSRDDLPDRRGNGVAERADPSEPGDDRPGAA